MEILYYYNSQKNYYEKIINERRTTSHPKTLIIGVFKAINGVFRGFGTGSNIV
ncbi:MAG: hypothetical protein KKE40_09340 [Planctomycetes bacterium]|nr:hypothetical protein [Planctomycetota bacterium]